ncbi:unnamed protein product [Phytophthora fragariaefolia]|uniref:Unnamed protein product n=1 Tax=Phytophthora fragariaefolia TaxID=1490495 RepID=A0A9W7D9F3_9STRA|nr:unnamed protein product [Phytophthora fragariaefolia]
MVHLAAVPAEVTAKQKARLFVDMVLRHHGMPIDIVSDRDPRFTARFWQEVFTLLGTQLSMSTADHPQTNGQTECVNRVLVDALKSYAHSFHHCSDCLPMAEFAISDSVHVSTGHTPFYVNTLRHPRVPSVLSAVAPSLNGRGYPALPKPNKHADMTNIAAVSTRAQTARSPVNEDTVATPGVDTSNINDQHTQVGTVVNKDAELNTEFSSKAIDFVQRRQAVIRFVQDAIAASVDRQKLNADNNGRGNSNEFKVGSLVLLATQNLAKHAVSDFGASKLAPRFIGPFTVLAKHGNALTHNTSRLVLVARRQRLLERADARSQDIQLRPKVDLHVRNRLRDLRELAFNKASSCFNAANSAIWRRSTASRRSTRSGGPDPRRLPAASTPTAGRTGGNSLDRPSDPDPRSGSFSYSLVRISPEPRYVGAAERPDAGRSRNGDGVQSPPPPKPPKGVKLGREL